MRASAAADSASAEALVISDLVLERPRAGGAVGRILDSINLRIEPGTVVAVTGASGAGKTSLLHMAAGLTRPASGTVTWGDRNITAMPEAARDRWRRETIGMIFQNFELIPELGVLANILLPASFDRWRSPPEMQARAFRLAEEMGLDPRSRRAGALSRGEQQRLAIARALLRRPGLILADEPTASLDRDNARVVADLLTGAAMESGASLLVVSHDEQMLERAAIVHRLVAGRLAVMQGPAR